MKALLIAILLFLAAGCATTSDTSDETIQLGCDFGSLDEVFEKPVAAIGKRFCGRAVVYRKGPVTAIKPLSGKLRGVVMVVMLPDFPLEDGEVYLEGNIDGMEHCFRPRYVRCTPFEKPLFLEDVLIFDPE